MAVVGDYSADLRTERVWTVATATTFVRTLASAVLVTRAAIEGSLGLLVASLVVYWVGDMLDGFLARLLDCETRIGAVLDILSDRFCAGAFYVGLAFLEPSLSPAIFLYLFQFMVVDGYLSIAFLAWPVRSPNYFFVVDRPIWLWNWSKPAKTANSALFAVLLLVTGWMWLGLLVAAALTVLKCVSLTRLMRLGLPLPQSDLPLHQ